MKIETHYDVLQTWVRFLSRFQMTTEIISDCCIIKYKCKSQLNKQTQNPKLCRDALIPLYRKLTQTHQLVHHYVFQTYCND